MSTVRIVVYNSTRDDDDDSANTYEQLADGRWRSVSEPEVQPEHLEEILFIDLGGALHIETSGTTPSLETLTAALPKSADYARWPDDFDVMINGLKFAPFPLALDHPNDVIWLQCEPDESEAQPTGRTIASASGIEDSSPTSGLFCWSLLDVGSGYVCFVSEPDGEQTEFLVEERRGRSNLELAEAFYYWVDWEPVACAVSRAVDLGGEFSGVASELDDDLSDSCQVEASVEL